MILENTISHYLEELCAKKPVPGGGSVAALVGALSASLTQMTGQFTSGKKFQDVGEEARELAEKAAALLRELREKIDQDVEAYRAVDGALKMPASTDPEKAAKKRALEQSLDAASSVPMDTARNLKALLDIIERLSAIANPNLLSDIGVAALLAEASFRGAALNVRINLSMMQDAERVGRIREELFSMEAGISSRKERVVNEVIRRIEGKHA